MSGSFDIDYTKLPSHVALIMDGNGRWASKRHLPKLSGHMIGAEALKKVVRISSDIGIKYLTVYGFSTENWKRSKEEVSGIFKIVMNSMKRNLRELHNKNVKINIFGDYSIIPVDAERVLRDAVELTKDNTGLNFNIALNYGGRDEIRCAVEKIAQDVKSGVLEPENITEQTISDKLYTSQMPDPDLIVRTSGELRLSNFMIWQAAYSELYFTDLLWPDFDENALLEAIYNFQNRKRNFGGR